MSELFGMGGPQMRAAGVEIITDYSEVAVVGITEIVRHLPSLVRAMDRIVAEAEARRPALAILTDFPGFHLRLARKLATPRDSQCVLHLSAVLGLATVARQSDPPPFCEGLVHLPVRRKVLSQRGCSHASSSAIPWSAK